MTLADLTLRLLQVDDLEVELNEVMRKYKAAVAQLSVDQITLQDQASQLLTLEHEKSTLKEQVKRLTSINRNLLTCQLKRRWLN